MFGSLESVAPVASRAKDLGLWQEEGRPGWSATFPPGMEPDPAIVRDIRSFCPNFVPLWVTRTFVTPAGGRHQFSYYALALHEQHPGESEADAWEGLGPVGVLPPPPFKGGGLYVVEVLANEWQPGTWQFLNNVPPVGEPFDRRAHQWMQATHHRRQNTNIVQDQMRAIRERREAEMAALDKGREDRKLANREDRFQLLRWLGKMRGARGSKATSSTEVPPTPKPPKARKP